MIKKILLISLSMITLNVMASSDETSDIKTILPGTKIKITRDITLKANRAYMNIGDRTAIDSEGDHYLVTTCEFKPIGGAVPYDRKISAGRVFTVTEFFKIYVA